MGRISTYLQVSADGYFAGPNGEMFWFKSGDPDPEFESFSLERARGSKHLALRPHDLRDDGGAGSAAGRRLLAVAAMFVGALVGAALVLDVHLVAPLAITGMVGPVSWRAGAADPGWVRADEVRRPETQSLH
jgi:hypothetical protein